MLPVVNDAWCKLKQSKSVLDQAQQHHKRIGLRNGDVIRKVNGYELNSPDKALEIYQKLKDASSVSLELQRRGRNKHLTYTIRG